MTEANSRPGTVHCVLSDGTVCTQGQTGKVRRCETSFTSIHEISLNKYKFCNTLKGILKSGFLNKGTNACTCTSYSSGYHFTRLWQLTTANSLLSSSSIERCFPNIEKQFLKLINILHVFIPHWERFRGRGPCPPDFVDLLRLFFPSFWCF